MVEPEKTLRKKAGGDETMKALLLRISKLEDRVGRLEAARDAAVSGLVAAAPVPVRVAAPPPGVAPPPSTTEEISEEVLLVIAATVAAFLGERAHVRQVRLVASEAWAQQGRVSVMASHRWAVHR